MRRRFLMSPGACLLAVVALVHFSAGCVSLRNKLLGRHEASRVETAEKPAAEQAPVPPEQPSPAPVRQPAAPPPAPAATAKAREKLIEESLKDDRAGAIARTGYRGQAEDLSVGEPRLSRVAALPGEKIELELDFTLLAPEAGRPLNLIQTVTVFHGADVLVELVQREIRKDQGTHVLKIRFTLPRDIDPGDYRLAVTLALGKLKKTSAADFKVRRP